MNNKLTYLFLMLLLATVSSVGYSQITWKVKTNEAKIVFSELGSGAEGTFSGLEATIKFDPANLDKSSIEARIEVKTATSKEDGQAADIISKDYLDAAHYPHITYKSSKIEKKGKGFELTGKLTIKKVSKEVKIPFEFVKKNKKAVFKGKISITSKDFGLAAGEVVIDLEVPVNQ